MAYPRHQLARGFKYVKRTAGNLSLTSTSLADVSTTLDMVLAAQIGDVIEYSLNMQLGNTAVTSVFDVATIVSAAPVNYFGGGAEGVAGWFTGTGSAVTTGSAWYTLVSGDLSSGTVTLRLRYLDSGATSRTLFASTGDPLFVFAANLGPVDPN